jgi:HAD superfamily hydrolase (TIGR01509 family)
VSDIRALIFDFDGLLLDTELPEYTAWQAIYADYGAELPLSEWARCVGSSFDEFDPYDYLEEQIGTTIDRPRIRSRQREHHRALIGQEDLLPGVRDWLSAAGESGIICAVASSSKHEWVDPHLVSRGIASHFTCVICREDAERVKPAPDLFLAAAQCADVDPTHCLVLEDSVNGIFAAKAAGMCAVAVPNQITAGLNFSSADLVLQSLADLTLSEVFDRMDREAR